MMTANTPLSRLISGLVLAGGEGRRMAGRDKGLITLAQKPLVEYAIECLAPLVDDLSISCNRNKELYQSYQLACFSDQQTTSFQGPMAGLVAGLKHAKHDWLLVMPCDTPLMTSQVMAQLIMRLDSGLRDPSLRDSDEADIEPQAIIFSHHGLQPLHGLYHKSMLPIFEQCLAENKNALQRLLRSMNSIVIHQATEGELSFNNANDPQELSTIEHLLAGN